MSDRAASPTSPGWLASRTDGGRPDRSRYVRHIVHALWPDAASIRHISRGDGHGSLEFVVVPDERRAVLLLPRRPLPATAAAVRNFKASARPAERVRIRAAASAARVGAAELFRHRIVIAPGPAGVGRDIVSHLQEVLGRSEIVPSLYIGPPRANRKPILQLISPAGETVGFAKVAMNDLTTRLVQAEAAALGRLRGVRLRRLEVPRLLHAGTWRQHSVVVQRAFPASSLHPFAVTAVSPAMVDLATAFGIRTLQVNRSDYWDGLRDRLASLRRREFGDPMADLLRQLAIVSADVATTFGAWHGDWTPWNMTMRGGRAQLWDWERFETGVPVGFDALHYRMQDAITRLGVAPFDAARSSLDDASAILAPFALPERAPAIVAALYLLEIGERYARDGQAEAGARIGALERWLLPALSDHVSRLLAEVHR